VSGEQLKRSIVPNSAVVFRYDIEYLLSDQLVSSLQYTSTQTRSQLEQ